MGRNFTDYVEHTDAPRSLGREFGFFHNSAITLAVPRDVRACHQVRRETSSNATSSAPATLLIAGRTRWKSTETQVISGFSLAGAGRRRRADTASTVPTCQLFQGGDTGPNPVGGAE
jgi:hypothetical protein